MAIEGLTKRLLADAELDKAILREAACQTRWAPASVRATLSVFTSATCSSMTDSCVFVMTRNRVTILFPGASSDATRE